jgi:hypothetical protein
MDKLMLRKIANYDRELLAGWLQSDPHHVDILDPEFFYPLSIAVEDGGYVAMYIKMVPSVPYMRLFVQFSPDRGRVIRGMLRNWAEFTKIVASTGASGIVFDTENPTLAAFCCRGLGFKPVGNGDYLHLFRGDNHES